MDDFIFHYCTACSHLFYEYVNLFSLNVNVIVNQCKKKKKINLFFKLKTKNNKELNKFKYKKKERKKERNKTCIKYKNTVQIINISIKLKHISSN